MFQTEEGTQVDNERREIVDNLRNYLEMKTRADEFSGVALVAYAGEPVLEYNSGFADRDRQIPNAIETKFNLGSINKIFTAVAIGQLIEQDLISFDTRVGEVLGDYPNVDVRERVTIHHLLTHMAGLGSFIDTEHREQFLAARNGLKTIDDVVALFKDRPLPYEIGEYHYSSDGYEVLGSIIEAVSGQDYYAYVRNNIFRVAGMEDTDNYEIDPESPRDDTAIGYTRRDSITNKEIKEERVDNSRINLLKGTAGGSGYSTAHDLLRFSKALLNYQLLSPEMTEKMLKRRVDLGSKGNQHKYQGYGFQIFDVNGVERIGHPGRFAGVNTRFDMYPEKGYVVTVLSNYDPPTAFDIAERATNLIV